MKASAQFHTTHFPGSILCVSAIGWSLQTKHLSTKVRDLHLIDGCLLHPNCNWFKPVRAWDEAQLKETRAKRYGCFRVQETRAKLNKRFTCLDPFLKIYIDALSKMQTVVHLELLKQRSHYRYEMLLWSVIRILSNYRVLKQGRYLSSCP